MDCSDRISFMLAEETLQPVRLMRQLPQLAAVTVRTVSYGRRFNVTVTKVWPGGVKERAVYGWSVSEVDDTGAARCPAYGTEGLLASSEVYRDPEHAYWAAADAISGAVSLGVAPV